jgi:hypothetical protein
MNTDYSVCQAYFTDLVTFQCINHEGSNYYETWGDYSVFAICDIQARPHPFEIQLARDTSWRSEYSLKYSVLRLIAN